MWEDLPHTQPAGPETVAPGWPGLDPAAQVQETERGDLTLLLWDH